MTNKTLQSNKVDRDSTQLVDFNGRRITNAGDAIASQDYVTLSQLNDAVSIINTSLNPLLKQTYPAASGPVVEINGTAAAIQNPINLVGSNQGVLIQDGGASGIFFRGPFGRAFMQQRLSGQSIPPNFITWRTLLFDTTVVLQGGFTYNASTGEIAVPYDGLYFFSFNVQCAYTTAGIQYGWGAAVRQVGASLPIPGYNAVSTLNLNSTDQNEGYAFLGGSFLLSAGHGATFTLVVTQNSSASDHVSILPYGLQIYGPIAQL
jgi:hypothetical protein